MQLLGGERNPLGQGVRVNSVKFLYVNTMERPTYEFEVNGGKVSFHFDSAVFCQKVRPCVCHTLRWLRGPLLPLAGAGASRLECSVCEPS
jgi:hypothetical protein